MDNDCYDCKNFGLCRLRDKAGNLADYFNQTGNFMGIKFKDDLLMLIGSSCLEYSRLKDE